MVFHGNFLNARSDYIHKNRSFRGFGSYGDILVRDRKMYVAPTPFGLLDGIDRQVTLILPADDAVDDRFRLVGEIERVETPKVITKYSFDLTTNEIATDEKDNPTAGKIHRFKAYRLKESSGIEVKMKAEPVLPTEEDAELADEEAEITEDRASRGKKSAAPKAKRSRRKASE